MLGKNTHLVAEEDRYFENESGEYRLRVDPRYDEALIDHFNQAMRLEKTDLDLSLKIAHVVDYVYRRWDYNVVNRDQAIKGFPKTELEGGVEVGARNLGSLLDVRESSIACWEKAAFCHLLLAELGVPSVLVGGKREGGQHAWLKLDLGNIIIDPTWRRIESKEFHGRYTPVNEKCIAFPARRVDESVLRTALIEARKYLNQNKILFANGYEQLLLEQAILTAERREEQLLWESRQRRLNATPVSPLAPAQNPILDPSLHQEGGLFEL